MNIRGASEANGCEVIGRGRRIVTSGLVIISMVLQLCLCAWNVASSRFVSRCGEYCTCTILGWSSWKNCGMAFDDNMNGF